MDLILPFSLKNKIQMYSCNNLSSKGIPINSVQDVTDAFGTSEFGSFGTQTQLVGRALKEKLLPLVPEKENDFERPSLIYIFTTGTVGLPLLQSRLETNMRFLAERRPCSSCQ